MDMDPKLQATLAAILSFFVVSSILATIIILCKDSKRGNRQSHSRGIPQSRPGSRNRTVPTNYNNNLNGNFESSACFDPTLTRIAMAELMAATQNFSPDLIVGDGSFGYVYKAKLPSGKVVAVKKLAADAFQGFREFLAEMETLGKIHHPNIVKILGYCSSGSDRMLIYDFLEKGSLDEWLHGTSSSSSDYFDDAGSASSSLRLPLSWDTRTKVVRGVANGLCYMHSLEVPIIHRDIKASNVLLDANFEAHIADFGLARRVEGAHSHVSTQAAGTMGYMPPEYMSGAVMATMQGDVYSFGVLMMEILSGRRPSFPFLGVDGKEIRLIEWVNQMMEKNNYIEMVDANILKDDLNETVVVEYFKIASMCVTESSKHRPSMKEVVDLLDGITK
ncbi:hypothetical protein LIER_35366 [Lithospermum erythrorhizon]|uniref:Protein kinase domain-containing protein n=1 Tax=Lithospermum erythrorhizon TaxID=34254 RepID=A0AAV3NQ95_LITER